MSVLTQAEAKKLLKHVRALREKAVQYEIEKNRMPGDDLILKDCQRLMGFVRHAWHMVEPASQTLKEGWAIEAIARHLEGVCPGTKHMTTGENVRILRLLMNVIPGIMKSMMSKVFWVAWLWGPMNMPYLRFVSASYSSYLSERDALKLKQLIESDWYQRLWPHVKISPDQAAKTNFHTTQKGFMMTSSVGGVGTGARCDIFIIDDPNNVKESESQTIRGSTNQWFNEVVPTRINDPETSAIVVIQQRTHENDVSGVILETNQDGEWCHLSLPMRYEVPKDKDDKIARCGTAIGFVDPRTREGELVFPERFPEWWVAKTETTLGPYATAAQFQQRPTPRGGGIITREDWKIWKENEYPAMEFIIASLDGAYTEKEENDYSALTVWGVWRDGVTGQPQVMLMYAWQERLKIHELVTKVEKTCRMFGVHKLLIENKANGPSVKQELQRMFRNTLPAVLINISGGRGKSTATNQKGDKAARAYSVQHLFHEGLIWRPVRAWAELVAGQLASIPKGLHDDLADTATMALNYLRMLGFILVPREGTGEHFPYGKELLHSEEMPYDV